MTRLFTIPVLLACLVLGQAARAEVTLQITEGVQGATPIAVVPFGGLQAGDNMGAIVAEDLEGSGRFKALPVGDMLEQPTTPPQVRVQTWQALGQEYLVIGQVQPGGGDQRVAQFSVFDVLRGTSLLDYRLPFGAAEHRRAAHCIADMIYKQLTGEFGGFAAPVAFVSTSGTGPQRKYSLQIADADGFGPQIILSSREPIMSPSWSPDGTQIAYVSFEDRRPAIYVQSLASGERVKVSDSPGINGAPAWGPDGRQLALTLSKDGNPNVYVMDMGTRSLRRFTEHSGIDTEPNWAPDGRTLVFTSDRGGTPQLYLMSAAGGDAQRLTFEGEYNARGVFSPDGRHIAFVHGAGGSYRIALLDVATRRMRVLSGGPLDESPGFSPNGRSVLYAARTGDVAQLIAVSIDTGVQRLLKLGGAEVRQPAWSPKD